MTHHIRSFCLIKKKLDILQRQFDEILRLKPFRDAIMHGMWDLSASSISSISTVRIRKREILTTHFTAEDLEHFYGQLARVNFKIRFPGGIEDLARQRAESGSYMSRRFLSMMTGDSLAGDWLFRSSQSESQESEESDA